MLSNDLLNEFSEFDSDQYLPAEEHFKENECYWDFEDPDYKVLSIELKNHYGEYESEQEDIEDSETWKIIHTKVSATKKIKKPKAPPVEIVKRRRLSIERPDTMAHLLKKLTIHEHQKIMVEDEKELFDGFKRFSINN